MATQKYPIHSPSGPDNPPAVDPNDIERFDEYQYTSWDAGNTWRWDPNTHFRYENQDYYVLPGEDITDRTNWKADTMSGYHLDATQYTNMMVQQEILNETIRQNERMYQQMLERNEMQRRWLAEEKARLAAESKKREAEAQAQAEKERRRLLLASMGRQPTLLTGGDGVEEDAPIRKRELGAV